MEIEISSRPRWGRRIPDLLFAALIVSVSGSLLGGPSLAGEDPDPQSCGRAGDSPDVIVGDLAGVIRWGTVKGITGFSIGTTSCNVGDCWLNWFSETADHPVIGQNMYRLKDGRFEHIGQSWLKHGFFALSGNICSDECQPTDGTHLGVNCSDPYNASLNGSQAGLGPKSEVNPWTGEFPFPFTTRDQIGDAIYKRLQVHDADLDPVLNPGAIYFVEGQYVAADDSAAGRQGNNTSFREGIVVPDGDLLDFQLVDQTRRELPGLLAWAERDPDVVVAQVAERDDGLFLLGSKATDVGNGHWAYEYAVQNVNSHRGAASFRVPLPSGASVSAIGFHDVDYHSGEPYEGGDWPASWTDDGVEPAAIVWATDPHDLDPDANALRWGTLYNFRFVADVPPGPMARPVTLGLFRPGLGAFLVAELIVPRICDEDGRCEPGEDCENCAADCVIDTPAPTCCGDDVCEGDEDPCGCSADCGPCLIECAVDEECDDGVFCNGAERCVEGSCTSGTAACAGQLCDELAGSCVDCVVDDHCDDGDFCNGAERCEANVCVTGTGPCPGEACDPAGRFCAECTQDFHCDDGVFCNGVEVCDDNACTPGSAPCVGEESCDEGLDTCFGCDVSCNDGLFCNGEEICRGDDCQSGIAPCPGLYCDERTDSCVGDVTLQPRPGMPYHELTPDERLRFESGRASFVSPLEEAAGLGPIYNAHSCGACHSAPVGGAGNASVTRFGLDDAGGFDPLADLGGSLLQSLAIRKECTETLPVEANVSTVRMTSSILGAGLIEAIADGAIAANADNGGRAHSVPVLETPGSQAIGRFGWKSQHATLMSFSAADARNELGLTNRLLADENAPNGDMKRLATCDALADPEDGPDGNGLEFIDRVTNFQRFLAPPAQTPRSGMQGEVQFFVQGCASCHVPSFTTRDDLALPEVLRNQQLRPYSDFLLHDMGEAGDAIEQAGAAPGEVRTAPLWGLRLRDSLWHDGRIIGGTFEERVVGAIALHDAEGSEARAAAQAFAAASPAVQSIVISFLGSLGRIEFDSDGDGDVDDADLESLIGCFNGGSPSLYNANHPCAVHDVDQDGKVLQNDYLLFLATSDVGYGGSIPDGTGPLDAPLRLDRDENGQVVATWGESCLGDPDYSVYRGSLGAFSSHTRLLCSTEGATSALLDTAAANAYYLVVPNNGVSEGSYGRASNGSLRPAAAIPVACYPQLLGVCR